MPEKEFLVACLCAEWCDACRSYRDGFLALAQGFPEARFAWVDIEDEADRVGDFEVENFPTVLIQRGDLVLFCGALPPALGHVRRLVEEFRMQSLEQSIAYASATAERRSWQKSRNLRAALGRDRGPGAL